MKLKITRTNDATRYEQGLASPTASCGLGRAAGRMKGRRGGYWRSARAALAAARR